jgi:beta-phosphoglucomutase-like phosphatase (HAD superfamily)
MRAVIFDLDGTLVDTVYAHTLAWQRVLRDAEIRIEGGKVRKGIAYGIATSGKREDGIDRTWNARNRSRICFSPARKN